MPDPAELVDPARSLPWSRPARQPPGRPTLSRDQIVDAALRILDDEGLAALSMRRLGQVLGAAATTLYWHVHNKDELLDLVVDRVIGEVVVEAAAAETALAARADHELPAWPVQMAALAGALRAVLVRHRGVAAIVGVRPTFGPRALAALERLLAVLVSSGFAPDAAILAATTLVNWASAFAVFEVRDPLGAGAPPAEREGFNAALTAYLAGLPRDAYPVTLALLPYSAAIGADRQFSFGLAVLLDGIASQVARGRTAEVVPVR